MAINLTSKNILVIEDHESMRETLIHILGSLGARFIVTAASGIDAINAMRIDTFDLVLCDYNLLGDKNGQQILDDAKQLKLLPFSAIFIMVTGENRLKLVLTAVDNKPDDYLIKPISREQLSSRLERCATRKTYLASVEQEIDKGNLYQAIQHCERLLTLNDKKMRQPLLKLQAELSLKVGDFKKAEEIYQDILIERDLPWARLGLGVVAFLLGSIDQAINIFQGLIEQYPMMLEAYDWLVKVHESLGDNQSALAVLNLAVTLTPMSILRQQKLALLADKTENHGIAKKAYTESIKLGRNSIHRSSSDYSGLANVYLKTNTPDMALKVVLEMSRQYQNNPEASLKASLLQSKIHQTSGNKMLARQAYDKALDLNAQINKQLPRELRLEIAKTFYLNGNSATCDEILNDLVKTNIDDKLFIKDIVALCDSVIGENHAATLIEQLQIELTDINNNGVRLFRAGDLKGALAVFELAIANRPENHGLVLNRLRLIIHDLKSSPDPEKILRAQSYINQALEIGIPHDQTKRLQIELDKLQHKIHH